MVRNIGILIPTLNNGGAEKQASILAKLLSSKANIYIIVPFYNKGVENDNVNISGIDANHLILFPYNKRGSKIYLYRILSNHKIDTLLCYLTWSDFWGVLIARIAGVKNIYQGIRNAELPLFKRILEKIGNLIASGVIFNNYSGAEKFHKFGFKNISVIPNCFLNIREGYKRVVKGNSVIQVISVGRFVAQKDYPTAINAIEKAMDIIPAIRYEIVGYGELEKEIKNLVEKSRHRDKISISIKPNDIPERLLNADIYLSTSLFEGTSNSIMEAMNASLPIVATNVGDNSYLVEDGYNGLILPIGNSSMIAEKIISLAKDTGTRNTMGLNSNIKLKEEFGPDNFINRYFSILNI